MKRLALLSALVLLAACSSSAPQGSPGGAKASLPDPGFDMEQTFGPGDVGYPDGPIDVKYAIRITNTAVVPITLKRINLHTVNPPGGAYTLTAPLVHPFQVTIPPNGERVVELNAHARSYGVSMRDREPVTVKGIAYYETAQGYINQVINQEIQQ
jgi:ABC-type Fe3+-hydroxamate transport system substrate-binding protein